MGGACQNAGAVDQSPPGWGGGTGERRVLVAALPLPVLVLPVAVAEGLSAGQEKL